MNSLPMIQTHRDQSVLEAAAQAGYGNCRVGATGHASVRPYEVIVAYVRVGRYGLPLPVFGRKKDSVDGEHCPPHRYPERLTPEQNRVRGEWAQQVASGASIPFSLFL